MYIQVFFAIVLFSVHPVARSQSAEVCAGFDLQLNAILNTCFQSVQSCLENGAMFVTVACVDTTVGLERFETALGCKGEVFADQLYATLCSDGEPCYQRASRNYGTAAYEACCGAAAGENCTAQCRSQLEALSNDLSCCVQTSAYVARFSTCRGGNTTLQGLYASCGLKLEKPCPHLFSIRTPDISPGCSATSVQDNLSPQCRGYLAELQGATANSSQSQLRDILKTACSNDCVGRLCSNYREQGLQTMCAGSFAGLCGDIRQNQQQCGGIAVTPALSLLSIVTLLLLGVAVHL